MADDGAGPSDEEDRRLFETLLRPEKMAEILRLKREDDCPADTALYLHWSDLNAAASWRLGRILGRNARLTSLTLWCNFDVARLCAGVRKSTSIRRFEIRGINLSDVVEMKNLAQFLAYDSSVVRISLANCHIGPDSLGILADALSGRRTDALKHLNLAGNDFGNVNLDRLVRALMSEKSEELIALHLRRCRVGLEGCASLATLLQGNSRRGLQVLNLEGNAIDDEATRVLAGALVENSRLMELYLSQNSITDESAIVLAGSLDKNPTLGMLDLRENAGITARGWKAFLDLMCDSASVAHVRGSNHALVSLGARTPRYARRLVQALAVDAANLLCTSLRLNNNGDKMTVLKHKLIWSHAQGRLNVGGSPLTTGVLPRILACFSTFSNETDKGFVQWHEPRLPDSKLAIMGLDAVFRILRSRPDLLSETVCCKTESKLGEPIWKKDENGPQLRRIKIDSGSCKNLK